MPARRLKASEVAAVRALLVKTQNRKCPLCNGVLGAAKTPALDHDHTTGYIRDALCINCNGIEGKVFNLARRARGKDTELNWLSRLVEYLARHQTPQHGGILHHTHKTDAEKRLAINKKARLKRAKLKKAQE
jgi:hypothetical protein